MNSMPTRATQSKSRANAAQVGRGARSLGETPHWLAQTHLQTCISYLLYLRILKPEMKFQQVVQIFFFDVLRELT